MQNQSRAPEIISTDSVIPKGDVSVSTEVIKIKASISITVCTLLIATGALIYAAYAEKNDLQTWATGLISAVGGAAISYGFNSRHSS